MRVTATTCSAAWLAALCLLPAPMWAGTLPPAKRALPQVDRRAKAQYVAVLMWHDVVAGRKEVWFDTTVSELAAQLTQIRRRKFNVISMDTLTQALTMGTPLPSRPLVLTFDDNDQGLYDNAYPLLLRFHYPATLFVHTNYVGVTTSKAHCDWPTLLRMQKSGLISVQGHTCSHPADLRLLSDAENRKEMLDSKALIERHMGRPCYAFAYPEGHFDDRVARLAAESGYRVAFTEDWGSAAASRNLFLLHRYSIHKRFAQALDDVEAAWGDRNKPSAGTGRGRRVRSARRPATSSR